MQNSTGQRGWFQASPENSICFVQCKLAGDLHGNLDGRVLKSSHQFLDCDSDYASIFLFTDSLSSALRFYAEDSKH